MDQADRNRKKITAIAAKANATNMLRAPSPHLEVETSKQSASSFNFALYSDVDTSDDEERDNAAPLPITPELLASVAKQASERCFSLVVVREAFANANSLLGPVMFLGGVLPVRCQSSHGQEALEADQEGHRRLR